MAFVPVTSFTGLRVNNTRQAVSVRPARAAKWTMDGKGFGGGEATREYVSCFTPPCAVFQFPI